MLRGMYLNYQAELCISGPEFSWYLEASGIEVTLPAVHKFEPGFFTLVRKFMLELYLSWDSQWSNPSMLPNPTCNFYFFGVSLVFFILAFMFWIARFPLCRVFGFFSPRAINQKWMNALNHPAKSLAANCRHGDGGSKQRSGRNRRHRSAACAGQSCPATQQDALSRKNCNE